MNRLIVLVAILALVAGFASAQPGSSNLDTGKELVAQLYKEHSGKSDPLQYPASKKRLPSYFYKPLLDLYLKDQEDSKNEVGKIDFDPLYDSQDFEISGFNLVMLPEKKGYVVARFKNMGVDPFGSGPSCCAGGRTGAVRNRPRLFGFPRPRGIGLRPGLRRPLRHSSRRQHRRTVPGRQR